MIIFKLSLLPKKHIILDWSLINIFMSNLGLEKEFYPMPLQIKSNNWLIKTRKISFLKDKLEEISLIDFSNKTLSSKDTNLMSVTLTSVSYPKLWLNTPNKNAKFKTHKKFKKSSKIHKWLESANICVDRHLIFPSEGFLRLIVRVIFLPHVAIICATTILTWTLNSSSNKDGLHKKPKQCSKCPVGVRNLINSQKMTSNFKKSINYLIYTNWQKRTKMKSFSFLTCHKK